MEYKETIFGLRKVKYTKFNLITLVFNNPNSKFILLKPHFSKDKKKILAS